jgi:hypothetical protein
MREPDVPPSQEPVADKHDAILSVASTAPAAQLRDDATRCDAAVRKQFLVTVRYVEQLKFAGLPWESGWKDRLMPDDRIVPYWAQALDGVLMLGMAAGSIMTGVVVNPSPLFSDLAKRPVAFETRRPLEAFKTCMESHGHSVEIRDRPDQSQAEADATGGGMLKGIEAKCAKEWPDDPAMRGRCEATRLDSARRGIISP